jgi:hypothetical protein
MGNYKKSIDDLKTWFLNHATINSVTFGDLNEIDLAKATAFPIAHIIPVSYSVSDNIYTTQVTVELLALSKDNEEDKINALDEMASVIEDFFRYTSENKNTIPIYAGEVIYDQLQNRLFGWSLTVDIKGLNDGCT